MAKMRLSFVTNSSSSSFIVAKRNDCTREDIESLLGGEIESLLKQGDFEYCYEFEELVNEHGKKLAIEIAKNNIIDELYGLGSMRLDNWKVESGESSSEGEIFELFMYMCNYIDNEKFKIAGGC